VIGEGSRSNSSVGQRFYVDSQGETDIREGGDLVRVRSRTKKKGKEEWKVSFAGEKGGAF